MDEIRKNNKAKIITRDKTKLEGLVLDYQNDRVLILISRPFLNDAKKLNELDDVLVYIDTIMGLKAMKSSVISGLEKNCIVLENTPTIPVKQKRKDVRVVSEFNFTIAKNNDIYKCKSINISAGGIAFTSDKKLNLQDDVTLRFFKDDFGYDIDSKATIIKDENGTYVAKYTDINPHDEDKIVKYIFNLLSKK